MPDDTPAGIDAAGMKTLAEGADMRFTEWELAPGHGIPWHIHSELADWHICLDGTLRVEADDQPTENLDPGGMCKVAAGTAHRLDNVGDKACRYVIVQGVVVWDFIKVER